MHTGQIAEETMNVRKAEETGKKKNGFVSQKFARRFLLKNKKRKL